MSLWQDFPYLEIVIITVALISWRLNVEIVPKVHPHKVPIICTDCPKALDPRRVVSGEARREELFGHWVSVGKVLAEFFLKLGRHCLGEGLKIGKYQFFFIVILSTLLSNKTFVFLFETLP